MTSLGLPMGRLLLMKTWRLWLALFATIGVASVLTQQSEKGAMGAGCLLILVAVVLFGALALTESHQHGPSGFPAYLLLLPASSFELVAWPMLLSTAALGVSGVVIAVVVFGGVAPLSATWWMATYLAGNASLVQAVTWLPFRNAQRRGMVSFATILSIVAGPVAMAFGGMAPSLMGVAYGVLSATWVAVTVRGVGLARHGLVREADGQSSDRPIKEGRPFRSRVESQVWLEVRRNGMMMRGMTAMFLSLFVIGAIASVPRDARTVEFNGVPLSGAALMLATLCLAIPPYFGTEAVAAASGTIWARIEACCPFSPYVRLRRCRSWRQRRGSRFIWRFGCLW